jgi:hypothetical protein
MATNTFTALDKVTVGTATSSITFSSIPSTYTDLVVVASILPSSTSFYTPSLQFNSDTGSNYSSTWMYGQGSTAVSSRNVNQTQMAIDNYAATPAVGYPMSVLFNVFNYANTSVYKTVIARGNDIFASAGETSATVGLWRSTSAITSLTVKGNGANFATGSTFSLYGIAAQVQPGTAKATGGTITYDSFGRVIHTFTSSGTFTPTEAITGVEYLVIAGGGGAADAGGGGAGGYRSSASGQLSGGGASAEATLTLASGAAQTVTVGAGGNGGFGTNPTNGSNSVFGSITSTGGGAGRYANPNSTGNSGGSGGGGSAVSSNGTGGAGTANQGYAGGGSIYVASYAGGGGGGGAGAIGGTMNAATPGNGGVGVSSSITGTATTRAGGGGGGNAGNTGQSTGGTGGGGSGEVGNNNNAVAGTANTGGGGGGGYNNAGKAGGSGIVIVRYQG